MNKTFINLEENDNFHCLRGLDLRQLLSYVQNTFLEYRETINIPKNVTFGVEIEYEGLIKKNVDIFIKQNFKKWISKCDATLDSGGEITSPVMNDEKKYWKELKTVCNYLSKENADTLHNAGGHVHVGAHTLGEDVEAWKCFLKLYAAYEHILFRFAYGDKINAREKIGKYAQQVSPLIYDSLPKINESEDFLNLYSKLPVSLHNFALNYNNVKFCDIYNTKQKNTLEFRSPNATTNEIVWQNNINAFTKMLISSKQGVINTDFLDYKLENKSFYNNWCLNDNICLKDLLEFVDLVFDNNLDKIYFLRQYLKDLEINYGLKDQMYTKSFVKEVRK